MKKKLWAGLAVGVMMFGVAGVANATLVYGDANLGNRAKETVTIDLSGLAAHTEITLNFDLFIMDSWDGNTVIGGIIPLDYFGFSVDGGAISGWTFDNFNYGDETNTDTADATGNFNGINCWGEIDRQFLNYNNGFTFAHSADTLSLSFSGYGSGFQGIGDESWSVRNLAVSSNSGAPVPEPATMLLMGSGIVGLIAARRKKKA